MHVKPPARVMNRPLIILLLCTGILFFFPCPAGAQDFTINDFSAHILVNADSSFSVKETLIVEFHRPRHGIYREIPYIYADSLGRKITTPAEVLSVRDKDGVKLKTKLVRSGNRIHIRIGDPDSYVSGLQQYEIFYKVENAILFLQDHDELYWNVTGNAWEAEIKHAVCTVSVPGKKTKQFWAACYTGRTGSTEKTCTNNTADNFAEFKADRSFLPGEGFTIAYGWDKGLVSPPSSFRRFLWAINLEQNWIFMLPLSSLFIMLALWYRKGRDPRARESVTVMYGPPQFNNTPLCPAEVGTLMDETLDARDITATIVGLAVKGYIKIEETKEEGLIFDSTDYYLAKQKEADDALPLIEREIMSALFGSLSGKMVSQLKNHFYVYIDPLRKTIFSELTRKNYFTVSPDRIRQLYSGAGVVVAVAATILISILFSDSIGGTRTFLAGILSGLPIMGISKFMPAKTRSGSAAYVHILGFEEFLTRAEKDQLVRMKDENLFSKFFPYALALNVADNWARAFEGIYQEPPEWYVSPMGSRAFSPSGFNRSVSSAMSSLSTAIFSAPRGSGTGRGGFSGGGSSGGGFGGGGGGSW
jgi:uncharacterized membrane protein YgcG